MITTKGERVRVRTRVIAVEEKYGDASLARLWGCSPQHVKQLRVRGELGPVWLIAGRPVVGARGVHKYEESRLLNLDDVGRVFSSIEEQGDSAGACREALCIPLN